MLFCFLFSCNIFKLGIQVLSSSMAMWAGKLKHDSSKGNGKSGYKEKDKLFSSLSILSIFSTNAELQ